MKKLKPNQIGPWCSYCENKVRAIYREDGFRGKYACDNHITNLKEHEDILHKQEQRITEADRQTWYKEAP